MTQLLTIASCIKRASELAVVSESPRLDIEIMLAHILQKTRTWLFTWPEKQLTPEQADLFTAALARRLTGEPVAHIIGQREFWSLPLCVNNTTLIPRPDTELLVETVLQLYESDTASRQILDLGTGTGAIALAVASEKSHWHCVGVDKEVNAVALAEKNRVHLGFANVEIKHSDWFSAVDKKLFDVIVSNPPYIDPADPHLHQGDVRFEPLSALVADHHGLADIEYIAAHARDYLLRDGWLVVEHGYNQGPAVQTMFHQYGYREVNTLRDFGGNDRVTLGQLRAGS